MKKIFPLIFFLLLTALSCKKIIYTPDVPAEVMLDIAYGTDIKNAMDIYLPKDRNNKTKVIILLHGGAFVAGDKKDFSAQSARLAEMGFAVFNVNYRLVDGEGLTTVPVTNKASAIHISDQLLDIKAAVAFIKANAAEFKISPERWAMTGHSAGGTLALLYAYGEENTNSQIKVAGNWAGVTDLSYTDAAQLNQLNQLNPAIRELFARAVGVVATNLTKGQYDAVSPLKLAQAGKGVPTVNVRPEFNIVFGLDFNRAQYQAFTAALDAKGVQNTYAEIAGVDHGFNGNWEPVLDKTADFFKSILNNY